MKLVQALSQQEVELLLSQCTAKTPLDVRNRAILMMLLDSGMRVSELVNLLLDDVDVKTGSVLIRHGKGGKQRVVRIDVKTQKALWRYRTLFRCGDSDRLFLNRSNEPLNVSAEMIILAL